MNKKLQAGDKLWFVGSKGRRQEEAVVVSVGRKWAKLTMGDREDYRMDISSGYIDGGDYSPPGRCYASKEEYDGIANLDNLWNVTCAYFGYDFRKASRPARLTKEQMEQIIVIMKEATAKG